MANKYVVAGKEADGEFHTKGIFDNMWDALDLANKLNREQSMFYYDYHIEKED